MVSMLVDDGDRDPSEMALSLRRLPSQQTPSECLSNEILGGLDRVNVLAKRWLQQSQSYRRTRLPRRA